MLDYPKTKYHIRGGGSVFITSPDQEKSLGPEWGDIAPIEDDPKELIVEVPMKRRGRPPKVQENA